MIADLYRHEAERLEKDPVIIEMVRDLRGQVGARAKLVAAEAFFVRTSHDEYVRRGGAGDKLSSIGGPARAIKKILGLPWEE